MSFQQHDLFRTRLNALPLSAGRRGIAAMVLVEIVRWTPHDDDRCGKTPEELSELLGLQRGEVLAALQTLEALGGIKTQRQGSVTHIAIRPLPATRTAAEWHREVTQAIHWHAAWKRRLRYAIEFGETPVTVEEAGQDRQCDFGCWLLSSAFPEMERDGNYEAIRLLHQQFHKVAAATLQLALNGRKEEAERAMTANGAYARASHRLVTALNNWRKDHGQ